MPEAAPMRHGHIACGTIVVDDVDAATQAYCRYLHQELIEAGTISAELANAWQAPAARGSRFSLLQAAGGGRSSLRLIEMPRQPHEPAVSLGWNAFELTVRDVFGLAQQLADSPFDVIGPPKRVDGFTSFIPMQVAGPHGEVLFLNQVEHSDDDTDLPLAQSEVGEIFIVVLASPDRETSAAEYVNDLELDRGGTHQLRYGLINRAFGFSADTLQTITMVQNGRTPFLQVDQYPASAQARASTPEGLPMGNAMVSVLVDQFDQLTFGAKSAGLVSQPAGALYANRRMKTVRGAAGELVELIERETT